MLSPPIPFCEVTFVRKGTLVEISNPMLRFLASRDIYMSGELIALAPRQHRRVVRDLTGETHFFYGQGGGAFFYVEK